MSHPTSRDPVGQGATGDTERRLRDALAEAAHGVSPSAVPLAAIERDGRRRVRRRRAVAMGGAAAVLLLPLAAVLALRPDASGGPAERVTPPAATVTPSASPSSSPSSSAPAGRARVVEPGERVTAAPGTEVWLTEEGKYWHEPDGPPVEFRSVVDGNLDLSEPGVSVQASGSGDGGYFLSGVYYGVREAAARVEIETAGGTPVEGTVLRLAGNTTWGVWYASAEAPEQQTGSDAPGGPSWKVTVYDARGQVIAESASGL
ncbi:hypothetical protein [Streptomyces poonensis]|uniref:Uncharacterized protein n=1 Tax=Streptomyces poonensis TaxID=68255 RepID=A0A918PJ82_9ACTN|nr:hypothetical protein [Streptomyces poonensis]GGZ12843.1 hypothetical protein GCM10010365_35690 [Streptomyces poonensis]GLJ91976.1 hypothetical protein GCM10017589_45840 [Streptomyces poonensis]